MKEEVTILQEIKFINEEDIIEKIEDGHSGALIYKIERKNKKYFLKVFNQKYNEEKVKKIYETTRIYKELNINSLKIIDYGDIQNGDKYYILYNYIEGTNLKQYIKNENIDENHIYELGKKIGKELLKLKNYNEYDKLLFKEKEDEKELINIIHKFKNMLNATEACKTVYKFFSESDIKKLETKLNEYIILLKEEKIKLIHGDIKSSNFMRDLHGKLYIIDIESMQLNYDIMNFKHQITWCLMNNKEKIFVKGFLDSLYKNKRPRNFNKLIIFMIIFNFFNASFNLYKKERYEKLSTYIENCRRILEKINNMDLDKEFII